MKAYHPKDPLAPIPIDWVEESPAPTPTPTPMEKSAFNKRLVEKKWFIRGESLFELQRKSEKCSYNSIEKTPA